MRLTKKVTACRSRTGVACANVRADANAHCSPSGQPPAHPSPVNRRSWMLGGAIVSAAALTSTWAPVAAAQQAQPSTSAPTSEAEAVPRFYKTASGVKIQEVAGGRGGPAAKMGDAVLFDYVLRRSNGYFIYATVEGVSFQPRDVPVAPVFFKIGDDQLIPGLNEVLIGMEPGSKRRALIPPSVGYTSPDLQPQPPTFATKRQLLNHASEPLIFEVQMLKVNP